MDSFRQSIQDAGSIEFGFWVVLLIILTAVSFFLMFYFWRRARIIEDVPTSKIRSAAQGYVEIIGQGQLMPGIPINAPLTGQVCTWYRYSVEEKEIGHNRGRQQNRWRTINSGTSGELFLLEDDTGQCVIDPDGAEVTPTTKDVWYGNSRNPEFGPAGHSGLLASGRYRYKEQRIHPGDHLYAIGHFNTISNIEHGSLNEDIKAILRQWKKSPEHFLKKFDANKDGEIDIQEWQEVRSAAEKQALRERTERIKKQSVVHMLKQDGHRPYILSTIPQDKLVQRYRMYATGALPAFLTIGSFVVWLFLVRMTA
jgi:hypothetical protein